jgi:ankyrin repeat protein
MAVSKLRLWLEDHSLSLVDVFPLNMRSAYRQLQLRLRTALRAVASGEERRAQALELCQVRGLLQAQADEVNDLGETRLIAAAADGESAATLELLCEAGADIHAVNKRNHNALMEAALNGHVEAVQALHRLGVGHTAAGGGGKSAVMMAAWNGHTQVVEVLVELKADVQAALGTGFTPLILAASSGHAETAAALARLGAALEAETTDGLTAAMVAAQNGHAGAMRALYAAGADLHRAKHDGESVAASAAKNGHAAVLRELGQLLGEADGGFGVGDMVGHTALMKAARGGHRAAVRALLDLRVDPGATDGGGETALFAAVAARQWELAGDLLAACGPKLLAARNLDGRTCLSFALEDSSDKEAKQLAAAAGADAPALLAAAEAELAAERAARAAGPTFARFSGAAGEAYVCAGGRTVGFRSFCSVRAGAVCRAGRRAYMELELLVLCDSPQFGFCGGEWRRSDTHAAAGVGDDAGSWGVDGARACAWHNQQAREFGGTWRKGDVVGLACDLTEGGAGGGGRVWVSVNGSFGAPNGAAFDLPAGLPSLYPALSARASRVRYNFGPGFAHAPPTPDYGLFEPLEDADAL